MKEASLRKREMGQKIGESGGKRHWRLPPHPVGLVVVKGASAHDHLLSFTPWMDRAGLQENSVTLGKLGEYQGKHANLTNAGVCFFFYISLGKTMDFLIMQNSKIKYTAEYRINNLQ